MRTPSLLTRLPTWLTPALGLRNDAVANTLGSLITPTLDVLQAGIPYATVVSWKNKQSTVAADLELLPADPNYQYLLAALHVLNGSTVTAAMVQLFITYPPVIQIVETSVTIPAAALPNYSFVGNNTVGLNDFPSPPRWVPANCSLTWQRNYGETGIACFCSGLALKIPAGFDVVPRGG